MLTPKQKLILAGSAIAFGAQAFAFTKFFHQAFTVENQANAMARVLTKHATELDEIDFEELFKTGLQYK